MEENNRQKKKEEEFRQRRILNNKRERKYVGVINEKYKNSARKIYKMTNASMPKYCYLMTLLSKWLDLDPEIKSQVDKMIKHSGILWCDDSRSALMLEFICDNEILKFEDENGMLIDIPPTIMHKFYIVALYTRSPDMRTS